MPFLRFLAFALRHGSSTPTGMVFGSMGGGARVISLKKALDALGFAYNHCSTLRKESIAVTDPLVTGLDSSIPRVVLSLSSVQLAKFIDWMFRSSGDNGKSILYLERSVVDVLQEIAVRADRLLSVSPCKDQLEVFLETRVDHRNYWVNTTSFHDDSWEDYDGRVYCVTVPNSTLVVRRNDKICISGNSGRHGNKGVIGVVAPLDQMPRTADGEPLDVIMNPVTVPNRIIMGPVLEMALSKVAKKEGNQIAVSNYEPRKERRLIRVGAHWTTVKTKEGPKRKWIAEYSYERDIQEQVSEEVERAGLPVEEMVFDPQSGKNLGKVQVGYQYIIKHVHQSEKKLAARAGGPGYDYDGNGAPRGSGHQGGQSIGELGLHALLAHGATSLIREGQTIKSDCEQSEVWTALQNGDPLPPPRASFAYGKFLSLLRAMGIHVDREDDNLRLQPLTDEEVRRQSHGELKSPTLVLRAKDLKPEEGGLFDEHITGGPQGDRWCFHGSTLVETEHGPVPIQEIVCSKAEVKVWSYDFDKQEPVLKSVVGWFKRNVRGEATGTAVFEIDGKETHLRATARHQVPNELGQRIDISDAHNLLTRK
jgi:hypothetical protein